MINKKQMNNREKLISLESSCLRIHMFKGFANGSLEAKVNARIHADLELGERQFLNGVKIFFVI